MAGTRRLLVLWAFVLVAAVTLVGVGQPQQARAQEPAGDVQDLRFSPGEGPPGSTITITGTCLYEGKPADRALGAFRSTDEMMDVEVLWEAPVGEGGSVAASIEVPVDAPPGIYRVGGWCFVSDFAIQDRTTVPFTVISTLPVVSIASVTEPRVFDNQCADPPEVERTPGEVVVSRSTTDGPLTVPVSIAGAVEDPAEEALFNDGAATASIPLVPSLGGPWGSIEVAIVAGDGYDIGDPSTLSAWIPAAIPSCAISSTSTQAATTLPRTGPTSGVGGWALAGVSAVVVGTGLLLRMRRRAR